MRKKDLYAVINLTQELVEAVERLAEVKLGYDKKGIASGVRTSYISDRTGEYAVRVERAEERVKAVQNEIQTARETLETAFTACDSELDDILCLKFINNVSYRQIALMLGLKKSYVYDRVTEYVSKL